MVWEDGGSNPASYPIVPSMLDSLEVKVLYPILMEERVSEAQGRRRETGSKRSAEQTSGDLRHVTGS